MTTQTKPTVTRKMKISALGDAMADRSALWFIASLFLSLPALIIIGLFHALGLLAHEDARSLLAAALIIPAVGILFALGALALNALAGKAATEQWARFYEYYDDEN